MKHNVINYIYISVIEHRNPAGRSTVCEFITFINSQGGGMMKPFIISTNIPFLSVSTKHTLHVHVMVLILECNVVICADFHRK